MGYIYKITNTLNNKCYIGQTKRNPQLRWYEHKYYANKGVTYKSALYNAVQKYGIDYFSFKILEKIENDMLDEREIYYINMFDSFYNGYNNTTGGDGNKGCKRKRKFEKEVVDLYKKIKSTEKIAQILKISRITVRTILKEKGLFEKLPKTSFDYKKKQVLQFTLDNILIQEFKSIADACKSLGLSNKNITEISKCCKGKRNTAYKYKWKYKHDMET